jgi:hypothetical protein
VVDGVRVQLNAVTACLVGKTKQSMFYKVKYTYTPQFLWRRLCKFREKMNEIYNIRGLMGRYKTRDMREMNKTEADKKFMIFVLTVMVNKDFFTYL